MNGSLMNGFLDELEKISVLRGSFTGIGAFSSKAGKLVTGITKPTKKAGKQIGKMRSEFLSSIRRT